MGSKKGNKKRNIKGFIIFILTAVLLFNSTINVYAGTWLDKGSDAYKELYGENADMTDRENLQQGEEIEEAINAFEGNLLAWVVGGLLFALGWAVNEILSVVGIDLSLDGIIYGRLTDTEIYMDISHFGLEENNPWGIFSATLYYNNRQICMVVFPIVILVMFIVCLRKKNEKEYAKLKETVKNAVLFFLLTYTMPYIVELALFGRDVLMYVLSEGLVNGLENLILYNKGNNPTWWDEQAVKSLSGTSGIFDTMVASYRDSASFIAALCVFALSFAGIIYLWDYVKIALVLALYFGMFPLVMLIYMWDPKKLSGWMDGFYPAILTPVVDMVLFMVVSFVNVIFTAVYGSQLKNGSFAAQFAQAIVIIAIIFTARVVRERFIKYLGFEPLPKANSAIAMIAMLARTGMGAVRGGTPGSIGGTAADKASRVAEGAARESHGMGEALRHADRDIEELHAPKSRETFSYDGAGSETDEFLRKSQEESLEREGVGSVEDIGSVDDNDMDTADREALDMEVPAETETIADGLTEINDELGEMPDAELYREGVDGFEPVDAQYGDYEGMDREIQSAESISPYDEHIVESGTDRLTPVQDLDTVPGSRVDGESHEMSVNGPRSVDDVMAKGDIGERGVSEAVINGSPVGEKTLHEAASGGERVVNSTVDASVTEKGVSGGATGERIDMAHGEAVNPVGTSTRTVTLPKPEPFKEGTPEAGFRNGLDERDRKRYDNLRQADALESKIAKNNEIISRSGYTPQAYQEAVRKKVERDNLISTYNKNVGDYDKRIGALKEQKQISDTKLAELRESGMSGNSQTYMEEVGRNKELERRISSEEHGKASYVSQNERGFHNAVALNQKEAERQEKLFQAHALTQDNAFYGKHLNYCRKVESVYAENSGLVGMNSRFYKDADAFKRQKQVDYAKKQYMDLSNFDSRTYDGILTPYEKENLYRQRAAQAVRQEKMEVIAKIAGGTAGVLGAMGSMYAGPGAMGAVGMVGSSMASGSVKAAASIGNKLSEVSSGKKASDINWAEVMPAMPQPANSASTEQTPERKVPNRQAFEETARFAKNQENRVAVEAIERGKISSSKKMMDDVKADADKYRKDTFDE